MSTLAPTTAPFPVAATGTTSTSIVVVRPAEYVSSYISTSSEGVMDSVDSSGMFSFKFVDDYVLLYSANSFKYLTNDSGNLIWKATSDITAVSIRFNYILGADNIIMFKYGSNFTQAVDFSSGTPIYTPIDIHSTDPFPLGTIIHVDSLQSRRSSYETSVNSFVVRYKTDSRDTINTLEPLLELPPYRQNYLLELPLDNLTNTYDIYINSLKNYYTSSYSNTFTPTISPSLSAVHREYTSIFTGSNQQKGYENIYLNFHATTLSIDLYRDSYTLFHAPPTLPEEGILVNDTTLVSDGAVAGSNPFTSDRISFSARDYRELSIPTSPSSIIDNAWQCAWLSAGDTGNAVWVDRYYYGSHIEIDEQQRLISLPSTSANIVDTPSTMKIKPNRLYRYFHQGKKNIADYVNKLKYIYSDGSAEILNVDTWNTRIIPDKSVNQNIGEAVGVSELTTESALHLNGSNYAIFPSSSSMQEDRELYMGIWLEASDWNSIQGSQIVGNFADSGYGLFNKQSSPTNIITLYDNSHNYIYNINSEMSLINETYNVYVADPTDNVLIQRLPDLSYIIVNSTKGYLARYDVNNNMTGSVDISSLINDVSQIELDYKKNIYLFSKSNQLVLGLSPDYIGILNQSTSAYGYDRIEILTKYNNYYADNIIINDADTGEYVVGVYGDLSVTDSRSNIWTVKGVNLYKNSIYIASIGRVTNLQTDSKGGLWLIHSGKYLTKFDTNRDLIVFTKELLKDDSSAYLSFVTININYTETDILIIADNKEKSISAYTLSGEFFNKIYLNNLQTSFFTKNNFNSSNVNFLGVGDFTGYSYQRKYGSLSEIEWRISLTDTAIGGEYGQSTYNLPFSTKELEKGKHYFSLVFSSSEGYIKSYIDSVCVRTINVTPLQYKINTSFRALSIGANTSKQGMLSDTINLTTDNKFIGFVYRLHLYSYAFNDSDIKLLYTSYSEQDLYKDLKWNINVGRRNYIEKIDKFFTFNMPGSKSKYFNIRVSGFNATDEHKQVINTALAEVVPNFTPADTHLNMIIWDNNI